MQKNQSLTVRRPIVEIPYGIAIDIGELLWRRLLIQLVPYMENSCNIFMQLSGDTA
jgi:hypothetical protein